MDYLDYDSYRIIYRKYLEKPLSLLDYVDLKKGGSALDLCCGGGEMALALKQNGFSPVVATDGCLEMVPLHELLSHHIIFSSGIVDEVLPRFIRYYRFDYILCRQAINYWLPYHSEIAENIHTLLLDNGYFIFNTFNTKPSVVPTVKEYGIGGLSFTEVSYLIGNKVRHVQCCEGYKPHFTEFYWITPEQFYKILSPYFEIEVIENKHTSIYICKKKRNK